MALRCRGFRSSSRLKHGDRWCGWRPRNQPRKADELRAKLIQAVIAGLVAAGLVGTFVRMLVAIAT
jgi:hypothetical protein